MRWILCLRRNARFGWVSRLPAAADLLSRGVSGRTNHRTHLGCFSACGAHLWDLSAQCNISLKERLHTLLDVLHSFANLFPGIARDMLRAVPVVSFNLNDLYPLGYSLVSGHENAGQPAVCLMAAKIFARPSILSRAGR